VIIIIFFNLFIFESFLFLSFSLFYFFYFYFYFAFYFFFIFVFIPFQNLFFLFYLNKDEDDIYLGPPVGGLTLGFGCSGGKFSSLNSVTSNQTQTNFVASNNNNNNSTTSRNNTNTSNISTATTPPSSFNYSLNSSSPNGSFISQKDLTSDQFVDSLFSQSNRLSKLTPPFTTTTTTSQTQSSNNQLSQSPPSSYSFGSRSGSQQHQHHQQQYQSQLSLSKSEPSRKRHYEKNFLKKFQHVSTFFFVNVICSLR
jgi:hypothetical protein